MDTSPDHTPVTAVDQTSASGQVQPQDALASKGKGKLVQDELMADDDEEDEEDDDDDEEDDEDEEMAEEESLDEIDPTLIEPRRTRGVRVDYSSAEAFKKAGIKPDEADDDEEETYEAADAMKDD